MTARITNFSVITKMLNATPSMKAVITTVFLAIFTLPMISAGQLHLQGAILDAETKEALPFASIYISNTSKGTNSDENGIFILENLPKGKHEILIS